MKNIFSVSLLLVVSGLLLSMIGYTAPILIIILGIGWLGLFSSGAILLKCQLTANHVCKCCREPWSVVTFTKNVVETTQEHLCPDCREEVF
ncbi:hypothetical protein [Natranaerofaba carboxydovora]|uniref:hypothetical protein n=1 Tax=Natranaerofaba carboxydovora TaxID=2742683 RepID=UPI001F1496D2|nr:hypothetical protein [Natranaerofaba carboxydovora]UMZ73622.1 hypothetical protein ACONDI_01185 [Natranaerofaba carboxydovora]